MLKWGNVAHIWSARMNRREVKDDIETILQHIGLPADDCTGRA